MQDGFGFWWLLLRVVVMPVLILAGVLSTVPIWIWMERRVCAKMQQRMGPNRVGWQGLFQPVADAIKLIFKEHVLPGRADRLVYLLAPVLSLIPAIAALAVIPFGRELEVRRYLFSGDVVATLPVQASDVNIGVLYILALSSLAVYGIVLAGWSSNNKWSLMGGIRSAAQMVSYELPMALAIIAVVLGSSAYASSPEGTTAGLSALSLRTAVLSQQGFSVLGWNVLWQFPAFVIFLVCAVAETNRAPFDLPEAESELVAGFFTEYGSFPFAMFFMGEYIHMVTLSSVATALFLGGWLSPFAGIPLVQSLTVAKIPVLGALAPIFWFAAKVTVCMFCYVWLRWTVPRMRWDHLMKLGWMVLLPLGLVWVVVVALLQAVGTTVAGVVGGLDPLDVYRILAFLLMVGLGVTLKLKPTPLARLWSDTGEA